MDVCNEDIVANLNLKENSNEVKLISLDSDENIEENNTSHDEIPKTEEQIKDCEGSDAEDVIIKFFPPAYIQRYARVREVLSTKLEKSVESPLAVLEVGCAEFGMHFHFKNLPNVEKIIYMDIDKQLLEDKLHQIRPLPCESLLQRERPLTIDVYAGCVTQVDARIKNSDPPLFAIVGIEILEHLNKDVEEKFVYTIFKKYAPPVVILTTPNSDFNDVLGLEKGKFRHWDHRFELTRAEFVDWCTMVCEICPEYTFTIEGIAQGPAGSENLGCLSQMAVFELKKDYVPSISQENVSGFRNNAYRVDRKPVETCSNSNRAKDCSKTGDTSSLEPYTHLIKIDYPWRPKPPLRERVINEIQYYINYYVLTGRRLDDHWENGGGSTMFLAISELQDALKHKFVDDPALYLAQLESWLSEEDFVVVEENERKGVLLTIPTEEHSSDDEDYLNEEYACEYVQHEAQKVDSEDEMWD